MSCISVYVLYVWYNYLAHSIQISYSYCCKSNEVDEAITMLESISLRGRLSMKSDYDTALIP